MATTLSQNLLLAVPLAPLAGCIVAGFFGKAVGRRGAHVATILGVAVAFVIFWRYLGWNLVLYLSALQVIPKDLYEAATIDGASKRQQFWYITLPQLRPMIYLAVTLTIMGNLQLFEEPFVLVAESSGVSQSVMTTAIFVYKTAFSSGDFGTASAISWLLFLIIASTTWVNNRIFSRNERQARKEAK